MRLSECYTLLEVSPSASLDDIKASYRKLAFKYHPDLNPGDPKAAQRFTRINEAYVQLKKHRETAGTTSAGKRVYNAETIRQEEEAKAKAPGTQKKPNPFYTRQEEVLKDILNDPFAKQVFEDIFSKLKRGMDPSPAHTDPVTAQSTRNVSLRWGEKRLTFDVSKGFVGAIKDWAARQLDDSQTVRMPARNLIPGTTVRVEIKRINRENQTIEVTLPPDFVVGRPVRLRGLGRRLGPWSGDLYLRFLVAG